LTEALERFARERQSDGSTAGERLARTVWEMAFAGDLTAAKLIYDRIDGRPTQRLAGPDDDNERPIPLIILPPREGD
jgi:hypothetical protein